MPSYEQLLRVKYGLFMHRFPCFCVFPPFLTPASLILSTLVLLLCLHFLLVNLSFAVGTSFNDFRERLVSKMICYVSSWMLHLFVYSMFDVKISVVNSKVWIGNEAVDSDLFYVILSFVVFTAISTQCYNTSF